MTFKLNFSINIDIKDCKLSTIITCFNEIKKYLLDSFIQQVIVGFATEYMNQKIKPFDCQKCNNNEDFIWKTKHGKKTTIITILQSVELFELHFNLDIDFKSCLVRDEVGE